MCIIIDREWLGVLSAFSLLKLLKKLVFLTKNAPFVEVEIRKNDALYGWG